MGSAERMVWPPATVPPAAADDLGGGVEDGRDGIRREVLGEGGDIERQQNPAAHGEHVAARVGGRDGPEVGRVVDERREEVGRRDQGRIRAEPVHGRVVEGGQPEQQVRIGCAGQIGDQGAERRPSPFGRAAPARGPFSELHGLPSYLVRYPPSSGADRQPGTVESVGL